MKHMLLPIFVYLQVTDTHSTSSAGKMPPERLINFIFADILPLSQV